MKEVFNTKRLSFWWARITARWTVAIVL